ncbi:MAG: MATE family efflux transporter [Mucilaginibacter polytrichastri]|nr:MATE family efflux transporter [Mucilaginibacter polytrichastri]
MSENQHRFQRTRHFFALLRQAVAGSEQDYTQLSLNKAIFLLAVPMILEMAMESLFAVVDIFFVSKLGSHAVATVGLTESMMTLVYSIAMGLSMAATAFVARRVGERKPDEAAHSAVQVIYVALAVSLLIGLTGVFFASGLLRLLGAPPDVVEHGSTFTRMMFGSNVVIMLLFLINGIFRGAGDASLAMRALWIANVINIILCPTLIFGFKLGLNGAALATIIGRGTGMLYGMYHLLRSKGTIKIVRSYMTLDMPLVGRIIKLASGTTIQYLIGSASWIFLIRIVAQFGAEALAGYTISLRIIMFTLLPAWGLSNAAATLVGQNLGGGHPDRAEQSVWKSAFYNMIFLGSISLIYVLFARQVIGFFTPEKDVIRFAVQSLTIISLGYLFYAYGMVVTQSFNGAGDTRTPTWLNIIFFWILQIPLAYFLALVLKLGPNGVFLSILIAQVLIAIASIVIFRRGKWKTVRL